MKRFCFKPLAWVVIVTLITSGCASSSSQKYSGQQKQQLETSVIEGSYSNVFNATRTVFLNEGLILSAVDKDSGFIHATFAVAKSRVTGGRVIGTIFTLILAVFTLGIALILLPFMYGSRGNISHSITATFTEVDSINTEVRLQTPLLEIQSKNYGIVLKRIFAEIKKQVMILEAAGRT